MDKKIVQSFLRKYSPLICYSAFKYMYNVEKSKIDALSFNSDTDAAIRTDNGDDFFYENFDKLNQEIYCFYVLYSFKFDEESTYKELKEYGASEANIKIYEKNCKEKIKNFKYVHYSAELMPSQYAIIRVSTDDLFDRKEKINNEKYIKRLSDLKSKIDIEQLFDETSVDEVELFCKNPTLVSAIKNVINVRGYNEAHQMELSADEVKSSLDLGAEKYYGFATDRIARETIVPVLKSNPEEFDLDKILLLYAYKIKNKLENTDWNKDSEDENKRLANLLKICKNEISKRVKYTVKDETIYSDKDLESDVKRIADDGYYISNNEESKIIESGENILSQELSHLKVLDFSSDNVSKLVQVPGVFSYLINNNLISKDVRKEIIEYGTISQEEIVSLFNDGIINIDELKDYLKSVKNINNNLFKALSDEEKLVAYMSDKATLSSIDSLSEEEKQELSKILKIEQLLAFYKDETKKDDFQKFSRLFASIAIREDNTDEIGESIIDTFIDNDVFEEPDVKNLYNLNLITIGNILEICETENVADMLIDGTFSNDDIKRICTEKERFDVFYNILKRKEISWENKVSVYRMSVSNLDISKFSEDKQERIKDYQKACEKMLNFDRSNSSVNPRPINPNPNPPISDRKTWNHYASDPQKRWDLFDSLGTYTPKILRSGVGVFKYERLNVQSNGYDEGISNSDNSNTNNSGPIIVESLFGDGEKPAYGKRTIVIHMDIEEFEKYEEELTSQGDIFSNISRHSKLKDRIEKFAHNKGWGDKIVDSLGFRTGKVRSDEDLKRIEQIIEDVKKSREIFKYANE